jgi:hypothetical protein
MKAGRRGPDPKHRNQCLTYIGLMHEQRERFKNVWICNETWRVCSEKGVDDNDIWCHYHQANDCAELIELEPCVTGSIFYISRDDPSQTHEFFMRYDPEFMRQGREKLAAWQKAFEEGKIPERPRTEDGKLSGWSVEPCKWCPLKKDVCKPDYQAGIVNLGESNAVTYTKGIRPNYDFENTRKAVLDRWK